MHVGTKQCKATGYGADGDGVLYAYVLLILVELMVLLLTARSLWMDNDEDKKVYS